jgi:hypothetical protein
MTRPDNLYPSVYVRVQCDDPPTDLTLLLGEERPEVSSGYGGWSEVARPKRTTVTTWTGQPARRMSLSLLFDKWNAGTSVETDIRRLERMALPRPGGQPPTVTVSAPGGVIPPTYEALPWVIDAIAWGDALMNVHGNRVRQAVTLTLLQYVTDDMIKVSPAKRRRAKKNRSTGKTTKKGAKQKRVASKKGRGKPARSTAQAASFASFAAPAAFVAKTSTVVYDGEDLLSVAARELGDASRWHEIADLNGIRDPRAVTRSQVIRLP